MQPVPDCRVAVLNRPLQSAESDTIACLVDVVAVMFVHQPKWTISNIIEPLLSRHQAHSYIFALQVAVVLTTSSVNRTTASRSSSKLLSFLFSPKVTQEFSLSGDDLGQFLSSRNRDFNRDLNRDLHLLNTAIKSFLPLIRSLSQERHSHNRLLISTLFAYIQVASLSEPEQWTEFALTHALRGSGGICKSALSTLSRLATMSRDHVIKAMAIALRSSETISSAVAGQLVKFAKDLGNEEANELRAELDATALVFLCSPHDTRIEGFNLTEANNAGSPMSIGVILTEMKEEIFRRIGRPNTFTYRNLCEGTSRPEQFYYTLFLAQLGKSPSWLIVG
jgi:hypothetical protein